MNPEPLILVFEGASNDMLDGVLKELNIIFKDTRFDNHFMVTNHAIKGIDNAYAYKLDEIITELKNIKKNLRKAKEALND